MQYKRLHTDGLKPVNEGKYTMIHFDCVSCFTFNFYFLFRREKKLCSCVTFSFQLYWRFLPFFFLKWVYVHVDALDTRYKMLILVTVVVVWICLILFDLWENLSVILNVIHYFWISGLLSVSFSKCISLIIFRNGSCRFLVFANVLSFLEGCSDPTIVFIVIQSLFPEVWSDVVWSDVDWKTKF